jgi:uncharacterized protein (DUF2062 family)
MTAPRVPGLWQQLHAKLKAQVPTREDLARVRWLQPIAHRLTDHALWHASTESVARGVAVGVFWAFAVPFAQIVFAAAHCVWWRANIPVAAAITFVTNPFTIGGWLYLAYQLGSLFVAPNTVAPGAAVRPDGLLGLLQTFGWPAAVGMSLFALGGSSIGYVLVRAGSRLWFHWRVARRARRRSR